MAGSNDESKARTAQSVNLADREWITRHLTAILMAMSDAVLVVTPGGESVLTNASYDQMVGSSQALVPEDGTGQRLPEEIWPQRRAARGESFTETFTLRGRDSARHWFEAAGQPMLLDGVRRGGVVVIRDVTDRSVLHLQEQFLATAAHELRTPLAALSLSLDLAARRVTTLGDEHLQRHVARAVEQTRLLSALVNELADVVRLQTATLPLQRQPIELTELIRHVIATVKVMARDQPIAFLSERPTIVSADARRIEQVLLNLLNNAVTYAPGREAIDVRLRRSDGEAEITISDHGPGIPPQALPHIFDRFFRVDVNDSARDGLGLGMYVAREILTAHGGSIEAISPGGGGATFIVRLPLLEPPRAAVEPEGTEAERP